MSTACLQHLVVLFIHDFLTPRLLVCRKDLIEAVMASSGYRIPIIYLLDSAFVMPRKNWP